MITIKDIAQLAGVSKSTISRYLNGGCVSAETKKKIDKVIKETGYKPNVFAQSLKAKKTGIIGVIIPRLGSSATDTILKSLDRKARENQQRIFIVNTDQQLDREIEAIETLAKQKVDYIILIATQLKEQHIQTIRQVATPTLILGQTSRKIPCISYDDYGAGKQIAEYIQQLGHKKVLYIGVQQDDYAVGVERKNGVLDTLTKYNIEVDSLETSFYLLDAYRLGLDILPTMQATYVVAATDNIALGILKAAYECGLQVPLDFSLSGFGGYESADAVYPAITTVLFPYDLVGSYALEQLNENGSIQENTILPTKLVKKQSTLPLKETKRK